MLLLLLFTIFTMMIPTYGLLFACSYVKRKGLIQPTFIEQETQLMRLIKMPVLLFYSLTLTSLANINFAQLFLVMCKPVIEVTLLLLLIAKICGFDNKEFVAQQQTSTRSMTFLAYTLIVIVSAIIDPVVGAAAYCFIETCIVTPISECLYATTLRKEQKKPPEQKASYSSSGQQLIFFESRPRLIQMTFDELWKEKSEITETPRNSKLNGLFKQCGYYLKAIFNGVIITAIIAVFIASLDLQIPRLIDPNYIAQSFNMTENHVDYTIIPSAFLWSVYFILKVVAYSAIFSGYLVLGTSLDYSPKAHFKKLGLLKDPMIALSVVCKQLLLPLLTTLHCIEHGSPKATALILALLTGVAASTWVCVNTRFFNIKPKRVADIIEVQLLTLPFTLSIVLTIVTVIPKAYYG